MGIKYEVDGDDLTSIADKIRAKGGTSALLEFPQGYKDAVDAIQTGITPTGTKNISTNGTHDVTNYASANVQVPASAVDSGTKTINSNGTHDVVGYASANVNVPNSYSSSDEGKVVSNGALVAQTSDTVTANDTYDTTLINSLTVNVSGGGGQVVTLLASGSYTKTTAAGASVQIPVSYTGTPTQVFVYAPEPLASTAQTYKWAWQVKQESEMETYLGSKLAVHKVKNTGGSDTTYIGSISLSADETTLTCGQQTSSYKVQPNTYKWYIWGYAS